MKDNKGTGGEGGIRTHGRVSPTLAFEASSFNRSDTSPQLLSHSIGAAAAEQRRTVWCLSGTHSAKSLFRDQITGSSARACKTEGRQGHGCGMPRRPGRSEPLILFLRGESQLGQTGTKRPERSRGAAFRPGERLREER